MHVYGDETLYVAVVDGYADMSPAASWGARDALEAAAVLLARGADIDARADDGAAPLHVAAMKDAAATA